MSRGHAGLTHPKPLVGLVRFFRGEGNTEITKQVLLSIEVFDHSLN